MPKYYLTNNASRKIKVGNFNFTFQIVDQFAGSWRGILKLEDPAQIAAFDSVTEKLGIKEIGEEDFFVLSSRAESLARLKLQRQGLHRVGPKNPTSAVPVVRAEPKSVLSPSGKPRPENNLPSVSDAIKVGTAHYKDPLAAPSKSKG